MPAPEPLVRISEITFDCADPELLGQFWGDLLGFVDDPANPNLPGDPEVLKIDPKGLHPGLLFLPVPEGKTAKNRLHLDLRPPASREVTVERVLELGGTVLDDRRNADGSGWVVMADPEGNELCVVRSGAERGEAPPVSTGERPQPTPNDERELLISQLDWYREGVVLKVRGVDQAAARATPGVSSTSINGVVKHLALVEDSWFAHRFAGQEEDEPWKSVDWDADYDWDWNSALEDDTEDLIALYEAACQRSRAVVAAHGLDDIAPDTSRREISLRWILVHMIEETARHLGHLDILTEILTGKTGE